MSRIGGRQDFHSLSAKDLLDARDHYHVHLSHLENVVGTAVGLYRIRVSDAEAVNPNAPHTAGIVTPRMLTNTVVKKWSWPCVLVFVDRWVTLEELRKRPEEVVPSRLYLPDGRIIPTCVVYAPRDEGPGRPIEALTFPQGIVGGGYPVLTDVQGEEHVGSLCCLVTDGDVTYALTNRHVAGEPGRPVFTLTHGKRQQIGVSDKLQKAKMPFAEVFPGLAGTNAYTNLDVGLVRIDDLRSWTAQVYGMGTLGPLVNLASDNITMDLVGCPVRAFGAASGPLRGEVMGLFYRYRSIGGVDFVADFLIGPRPGDKAGLTTRPGDSGTLWCWEAAAGDDVVGRPAPKSARKHAKVAPTPEKPRPLRPIAMQWGGQALVGSDGKAPVQFALATTLSQVCRVLDVEVVREWGTGHNEYWGKVGHYKVGAKACELVTNAKLKTLLMANQDRIAVSDQDLIDGRLPMANQTEFIALADVADLVWRAKRKMDEANHFADLDQAGMAAPFKGQTLMDLWFSKPSSRTPATWTAFYDTLHDDKGKPLPDKHRGALPFRVAEMYEALVGFVKKGDVNRYVAAAGLMAHFVGDACQPLHVSSLHHGRPGHPEEADVHSVYETKMLDRRTAEVVEGVNRALANRKLPTTMMVGGAAAAHRVAILMRDTVQLIAPIEVIDAFNAEAGRGRIEHMWDELGERTCKTIANGSLALAHLWQSAWIEGGGAAIAATKLKAIDRTTLRGFYMDRAFLESRWLRDMTGPTT
jgi:hypothetical protein